ncbi:unnamed protein product [Macrosiphum euphorbiae]|uniref:HAT C-terminal dimerisation domain-containing protein n=1 Tax=Macrosiphum euphorbiae TaxID=13131 RepID=A0AAV0XA56_9HEMI|nr:unnamed protein product [Macrosiphum euphorbiae]
MDSLISELNKRKIDYEDINEKFKFLFCITEISSCESYLLTLPKDNAPKTILGMLQKIIETSNCSAERSFSALKRIKTYLRSSTKEDRLNDLPILNIESELTVNINYDDIINKFSELKARRKM